MRCPTCGKFLQPNAQFCTGCGKKIEKTKVMSELTNGVLVATVNERKFNVMNHSVIHKEIKTQVMEGSPAVVLNLEKVEAMDTVALGMVNELLNYLKKNFSGKLVTCCQGPVVKKIFEVSGYSKLIENFNSVEDAIKSLKSLVIDLEAKRKAIHPEVDFDNLPPPDPPHGQAAK